MSYSNGQHGPQTGRDIMRRRVLILVRKTGEEGATTNEIASATGLGHTGARYHLQSLTADGWLVRTGYRRADHKGQRRAIVYWAVR